MALQTVCEPSAADRRPPSAMILEIAAAVTRAVTTLLDWQQRASERRTLSGLDPSFLKDMGIDQGAAYREASKPFWRE